MSDIAKGIYSRARCWQRRTQGGGGQPGHGPPYALRGDQHVFCPPPRKHRMAIFRQLGPFRSDRSKEPKSCQTTSRQHITLPFFVPKSNFSLRKGTFWIPKDRFWLRKQPLVSNRALWHRMGLFYSEGTYPALKGLFDFERALFTPKVFLSSKVPFCL